MADGQIFNLELIKKYDKSGPRYTSYPTAVEFNSDLNAQRYQEIAQKSNKSAQPLSLYFHVPFCDTVCFYCGCNKIATKDRSKSPPYLTRIGHELKLQSALFDDDRVVEQLHFGGGTPTFLNNDEIRGLMSAIRENFQLLSDDTGEYSIEIDPREATPDTVKMLRAEGFNRMSLGVQDFNPEVQKSVNRVQSAEETFAVLDAARSEGFHSISIDLIYGLPHQTPESFSKTLQQLLVVRPDRLSVFNYAHLPQIFKPQRRIDESHLPSAAQKLQILQQTMAILADAGYVYIGMDHFALPDDELARAQNQGDLYRNFQGYSTHSDCDLIGFGVSSISMVGNCYAQNVKTIGEYESLIDDGKLAVFRGIELNRDDILRREVITILICNFALSFAVIEDKYDINFAEYFRQELSELSDMQGDGLLILKINKIKVLPPGRLLIRNICMVFDRYLRNKQNNSFSKLI